MDREKEDTELLLAISEAIALLRMEDEIIRGASVQPAIEEVPFGDERVDRIMGITKTISLMPFNKLIRPLNGSLSSEATKNSAASDTRDIMNHWRMMKLPLYRCGDDQFPNDSDSLEFGNAADHMEPGRNEPHS